MWFKARRRPRVGDEIRFHRDKLIEQHLAAGLDRREAERRAFLELGNPAAIEEAVRDVRGRWLDDLFHDARFALRVLRRSPAFTLATVLTLALGIGVNIAMFSFVNGLLLRPLFGSEVVGIYHRRTAPRGGRQVSYPDYLDVRNATTDGLSHLAAESLGLVGLDAGDGPRRTLAAAVSANYFDTLGASLALGRPFTEDEERPGAGVPVAIVGYDLWERQGADSGMIGRLVQVNGEPFTVVGVAPAGFSGTGIPGPELWLPLGAFGALDDGDTASTGRGLESRDRHALTLVGRLRPGVSRETLAPLLTTVGRQLEQAFPTRNRGYTFEVGEPSRLLFMPGAESVAMTATFSALLMLMPGVVLLVGCLNLANLLLARGYTRRRELAIRSALGGSRARLTRQLLAEGLLLALAGGTVGLVGSTWATDAVLATLRPLLPLGLSLPVLDPDWRVLAGAIGFCVVATLVFGAYPARTLTRRTGPTDLKRQAGEEGRWRPGGTRIGNALVVGQVALSVLLLSSGGLFVASVVSAGTADPGFSLDGGLLVEVDPGLAGYDEVRGREVHRALVDRLRAVPGLASVTIGSDLPFSGFADSRDVAPAGTPREAVGSVFQVVGRDYARTLGLPMQRGRDFTEAELIPGASEPVTIVDDALASQLWPGNDALGQLIEFRDPQGAEAGRVMRVVGIVPAVKHSLGNPQPFPHVYVPLGQHYESAMAVSFRVSDAAPEEAMRDTVAGVVRSVDERLPVVRIETWRERFDRSPEAMVYRTGARTFGAFAVVALLLAVIGIYGVKSYVVSRRTREFGIRIAAGARPPALLWQVLREGGRLTTVGVALGLLLSLGAGRILRTFLYGVDAVEPIVLATAPLVLIVASLLASAVPAWRATQVDPIAALRAE